MNKDSIEKCKTCENYDVVKSTENWNVCNAPMPIEVALSNDSMNCEKYKEKNK